MFHFYPFGYPLHQRFSELGGPTDSGFGMVVDLSSVLDKFVFVFRLSAAVQKYGGPKTIGIEILAAPTSAFCPPVKKGGTRGRMSVDTLCASPAASLDL